MTKIAKMKNITSITVGPDSRLLPDGTIENPAPYRAVDITFDDGITVQVERPLSMTKVRNAYQDARQRGANTIDGIATDTVL